MRQYYLFILLLLLAVLTACGSEELMTPPVFSNVTVRDSLDLTKILTSPFQNSQVTITGTIDDVTAEIVASSTVSGELTIIDGSWAYAFAPAEGANLVTFTASDQEGNINQLFLTVTRDTTPPSMSAVAQGTNLLTLAPQLIVIFSEEVLISSLKADGFVVLKDGVPLLTLSADPLTTTTTSMVTLPLSTALSAGTYQISCVGITDLSTPTGNSVATDYLKEFTIE